MPDFAFDGDLTDQGFGLHHFVGCINDSIDGMIGGVSSSIKINQILALSAFSDHHDISIREKFPISDSDIPVASGVISADACQDFLRLTGVAEELDCWVVAEVVTVIGRQFDDLLI